MSAPRRSVENRRLTTTTGAGTSTDVVTITADDIPSPTTGRLDALEKKIRELEAKVSQLEKKLSDQATQIPTPPK